MKKSTFDKIVIAINDRKTLSAGYYEERKKNNDIGTVFYSCILLENNITYITPCFWQSREDARSLGVGIINIIAGSVRDELCVEKALREIAEIERQDESASQVYKWIEDGYKTLVRQSL